MSIKIKLFAKLEFSVHIVAMLRNKYHASNMLCLHQYRYKFQSNMICLTSQNIPYSPRAVTECCTSLDL